MPNSRRDLVDLVPDNILDNVDKSARSALQMIRIDRIHPNPEQPRLTFSGVALEELAESIRNHGVLTPLLVRRDGPQKYILIAGERRLRASGLAGLETVPVWVRDDVSSQAQLTLALVENLQREDLDPVEIASSYRRMIVEFGMTQAEVAERVGRDRATVANSVRLLKLPEMVLASLRQGDISAGHAKALLPITNQVQLKQLLTEILRKELSVRATEHRVSAMQKPSRRAAPATKPGYQRAVNGMSRSLGTRVRIEPRARGKRGKIVIEYFSPEELDRLVAVLSSDEK